MLDLILEVARTDDHVRGVIMNGSRVNPNAPRDIFQDYDIVYVVSSVEPFVRDRGWIGRFGELIILQTPDEMVIPDNEEQGEEEKRESFGFLMLFSDGNRIDLCFYPVGRLDAFGWESLSRVLLDKDGLFPALPPASDRDFLTTPPTAKQYADCCNEFWWVSTYVAKGLWRRELPYAKWHLERPVRDMLDLMLRWYVGVSRGFSVDAGKCGKYFERCLEPTLWAKYAATYAGAEYAEVWLALFAACDLFREIALQVADHFGYEYPAGDDDRVTAHLEHVRALPADAEGVY